jgi:hypothetical protein
MIPNPILDSFNISAAVVNVTPKGEIYLCDKKKNVIFGKITINGEEHVKLSVGDIWVDSEPTRVLI